MATTKNHISLTKHKYIESTKEQSANVFVYNAHTSDFNSDWIKRLIAKNDSVFVIQDTDNIKYESLKTLLEKKNYFVTRINCSEPQESIRVNPFDLAHDTSEIHNIFNNFLYAFWDNNDPDIQAMSHMVDAFASTVYYVFINDKAKRNVSTLLKMINSMNARCVKDGKSVPIYEALFLDNPDPNWIPKKYYAQFLQAAGDQKDVVANKVKDFFNMIPESAIQMMNTTDESLSASLYFKTAIFINADSETDKAVANIVATLLMHTIESADKHTPVVFAMHDINADRLIPSLPKWIKTSVKNDVDFIVFCNNLNSFNKNEQTTQFLNEIKKNMDALLFVHNNSKAEKEKAKLSEEEQATYHNIEYVATIRVKNAQSMEDDEVF